jgi:hypothetical protein
MDVLLRHAQEKLDALDRKWRHNFLRTFCFDLLFIGIAVLCILITFRWSVEALVCVGVAKLLWTMRQIIHCVRSIRPHLPIIRQFAPILWRSLWQLHSISGAIKHTTSEAFLYVYAKKVPAVGQTAHIIASAIGATPSQYQMANTAAEKCYPVICRCMRRILVVNVLCFFIFYGILSALVKWYLFAYF